MLQAAQFGVTAHPYLPIADHTRLALLAEDHRTAEDIERDTQREAVKNTYQLFPAHSLSGQTCGLLPFVSWDLSYSQEKAPQSPLLLTAGPTLHFLVAGESGIGNLGVRQ